jgi:hypothetical protein
LRDFGAALELVSADIDNTAPSAPLPCVAEAGLKGVAESGGDAMGASPSASAAASRSRACFLALPTTDDGGVWLTTHRRCHNRRKNMSAMQRANTTGGTMAEVSIALRDDLHRYAWLRVCKWGRQGGQ